MKTLPVLIITVFVSATAITAFLAKNEVDSLQRSLGTSKSELARVQKSLETTQASLDKMNGELGTAHKEIQDQSKQLADATAEKKEAEDKIAEKDDVIKEQAKKLAAIAGGPGPDAAGTMVQQLKDNDAKITALTADRDRLTAELTANVDKDAGLAKEVATLQQQLTSNQERVRHYEQNVARLGLTGRVLAVNPGWNFVVLNVGDKDGAAPNAGLVVSRNGQNIARGRVTTVEQGRSVASILPQSMARGETVQPGDQVVFTRL